MTELDQWIARRDVAAKEVVAEHDYIVEIPEGLEFEHITDFVRGWFKAEVQILICKDCGERSVGWRFERLSEEET